MLHRTVLHMPAVVSEVCSALHSNLTDSVLFQWADVLVPMLHAC